MSSLAEMRARAAARRSSPAHAQPGQAPPVEVEAPAPASTGPAVGHHEVTHGLTTTGGGGACVAEPAAPVVGAGPSGAVIEGDYRYLLWRTIVRDRR